MPTKAELIRGALAKHPQMKPAQIARLIMQENEGVKVDGSEVSKYKSGKQKGAKKAPGTEPAPAPPPRQASVSERVAELKRAALALGGIDEARRILDLLS